VAEVSGEGAVLGFRAWADSFRGLAGSGPDMVARAAELANKEIRSAIAEGRSADGTPWAPRKTTRRSGARRGDVAGKGRVLANADAAVEVRAIGTSLVVVLTGPEVFHQFGAGGKPERPIIPTKIDRLGNAIRLGVVEMADEWLNAHRRDKPRPRRAAK